MESEERKRILAETLKNNYTSRRATHKYSNIHVDKVLDVKL